MTFSLQRALREKAHDVRVIVVNGEAPEHADERDFVTLGFKRGRSVLAHVRRLADAVGDREVVLVTASEIMPAALRVGGYAGPLIAIEHGSILQRRKDHWRNYIRAADRVIANRSVHRYVAVSRFVAEHLRSAAPRSEIAVIHNGVDVDRYTPGRRTPAPLTLGVASRLIEGKGVDSAIAALSEPGLENVALRIAGDGPSREALEAQARRAGIAHRVRFLGTINDTAEFWRGCDIALALPDSWVEAFGIAAIEAMATGLPIVAARNGGLVEVVTDETGELVRPRDPRAVAAAVSRLMDPKLRALVGARARARACDRFSIKRAADSYDTLVGGLIKT